MARGFGKTEKVFYGRPEGADKTAYIDYMYYTYTSKTPCKSLEQAINSVLKYLELK